MKHLRAGCWSGPALALGALLFSATLLECGFRVFGIRAEYPTPRRNQVVLSPDGPARRKPYAFVPHAVRRSTYASNPRGYFDEGNSIDHVHNSQGWRDVEHTLRKPDGSFRILGLGDSYLWGQGVRYDDIVLTRLGRLLEQQNPGVAIETINTGMSSSNTVFQRNLLRDRGLEYDPDLIILFYVLNDVEERLSDPEPDIEFFENYTSIYQQADWLTRYSYLWGWMRQRVNVQITARQYIRSSVEVFAGDTERWVKSREALNDIQAMAAEHDIPLLVVIFPFFHDLDGEYPFQIVHDVVRKHCEKQGIAVLDLRESYRGYNGPELWVHETDQHPNEIAHAIAARSIFDFLRRQPARWNAAAVGRTR